MHQEKYNLNWHTYSDHLKDMLHDMMKSNELTDVTLVCDDKRTFKAHKVILSACSSVFKSIIKDLPQNNSVIYLRGIQHQEMESILEFMYLGVATFYQERMNEFLNVAKNLEIKEISKDVEFDDENLDSDSSASDLVEYEKAEEPINNLLEHPAKTNTGLSDNMQIISNSKIKYKKNTEGRLVCDQCERQFSDHKTIRTHIESIHEGVKYPCNQCNYQATQKTSLEIHVKSKHEGMKFACDQCDFQSRWPNNLRRHKKENH